MSHESVKDQINKILNEYIDQEEEKIENITKEVAEDVAKQLKQTSPKSKGRGKHYANGWKTKGQPSSKTRSSIMSVVYNATKPQLTHLLAKPHDIVNQYGTYGRSKPDPHIENAEEYGNNLYLQRLEREL